MFMEADEDPPEMDNVDDTSPIQDEPMGNEDDNTPPDIQDDVGMEDDLSSPDDMSAMDDFQDQMGTEDPNDPNNQEDLVVDEKIELILKKNLYNNYLALIDVLNDIETNFLSNNDAIYSKNPEASELLSKLTNLKDNVISYTALYFMKKPYSASALLYNKIKAYLNIIIERFGKLSKKADKV